MLIKIYGEEKLIKTLELIKELGWTEYCRTIER